MLKKDITFIYSDSAEKAIYEPLAEEAGKRGYKVRMTDNSYERCEIGFYCQHVNFPQYSRFSLIMLHDIIQQYGDWPDIWINEPWNKYDIGILPSEQWVRNWKAASPYYYARPRRGMYKVGWPKADVVVRLKDPGYREAFCEKYGLDRNKRTVLYAPAWENDNKEDDFVRAVQGLDVNIIIKQWDADPKKYPEQVENVQRMKAMHENLSGITILPPETNIFVAIAAADILVSEESSTMCEATMMGIPAVSVSDWLIPDRTPARKAKCGYDFVFPTVKAELMEKIRDILTNYIEYQQQTAEFCRRNFENIGKTSGMIMDMIDDCVEGKAIRYSALKAEETKKLSLRKWLGHRVYCFRREAAYNYAVNHKVFGFIWNGMRKLFK